MSVCEWKLGCATPLRLPEKHSIGGGDLAPNVPYHHLPTKRIMKRVPSQSTVPLQTPPR